MTQERKTQIEEHIVDVLKTVYDPEIPVNIFDLGMIYKIDVKDDNGADSDTGAIRHLRKGNQREVRPRHRLQMLLKLPNRRPLRRNGVLRQHNPKSRAASRGQLMLFGETRSGQNGKTHYKTTTNAKIHRPRP